MHLPEAEILNDLISCYAVIKNYSDAHPLLQLWIC